MERDKEIQLFTAPAYRAICVNVAGDDGHDLYQDLFLYLYDLSDEKLQEITTTCPECWFARAARQQYRSKSSSFHKTYRQDTTRARDNEADILHMLYGQESDPVDTSVIMDAVDSLHWYDYYVLIYYVECGSLRALSRRTGIPVNSLHNSISISKRTIKKYINDHSDNRG